METEISLEARRTSQLLALKGIYKFRTGIPELDEALGGGIPAKLTVALFNDPENDASTFCQQFVWEGLTSGSIGLYFCYDHHPDTVRSNMARFGWNTKPYEEEMDLYMVDCYSARAGERGREKYWLERPFEPQRLIDMIRAVETEVSLIKPNRPVRGIVDSFSTLITPLNFQDVLKVVLKLQGIMKKGNYVGLGVLHKGIHGDTNEFALKHSAEGVIELFSKVERNRLRQYMRVTKMSLTHFTSTDIPYTVSEHGIDALI